MYIGINLWLFKINNCSMCYERNQDKTDCFCFQETKPNQNRNIEFAEIWHIQETKPIVKDSITEVVPLQNIFKMR